MGLQTYQTGNARRVALYAVLNRLCASAVAALADNRPIARVTCSTTTYHLRYRDRDGVDDRPEALLATPRDYADSFGQAVDAMAVHEAKSKLFQKKLKPWLVVSRSLDSPGHG